jgi:hypothetical protein
MAKYSNKEIGKFLNRECEICGWEDNTWRDWFKDLLITLWQEGECFSGKRPNCDSGWQWELIQGLTKLNPDIAIKWKKYYEDEKPELVQWDRELADEAYYAIMGYFFDKRKKKVENND